MATDDDDVPVRVPNCTMRISPERVLLVKRSCPARSEVATNQNDEFGADAYVSRLVLVFEDVFEVVLVEYEPPPQPPVVDTGDGAGAEIEDIVRLTVAKVLCRLPSSAIKLKLSLHTNPMSGVYWNAPELVNVILPCRGRVARENESADPSTSVAVTF